jgi:hypothetical protein
MILIITEDRNEHTLDILIWWDFTLEYHIAEFDRFLLDCESRIFSDTEFHLVGCIVCEFYLHGIRESEFCESLIDESLEIFEFCTRTHELDDHK